MASILPRTLVSRYRLERRLGAGSFAETFLARDRLTGATVAVKLLREQYADDPDVARRFAREARAAGGVHDPHVVAVLDHGREENALFTVMELVDGENVRDLLRRRGRLPLSESLAILDGVLHGLEAIHTAAIVHRDVKPENVLLTTTGTPKLTDFGIARTLAATKLTATGVTLGTATYMAPEQASGGVVGPAVDLYAAGIVLFELLTGRAPFQGDDPIQVLFQHVHHSPPRPATLNPDIPAALDAVILRALAKDPAQRFPSAAAMRAALHRASTAPAPEPTLTTAPVAAAVRAVWPPRPAALARSRDPLRTRWAAGTLGLALLLGALGVTLAGSLGGDTAAVETLPASPEPLVAAVLATPGATLTATPSATSIPTAVPTPTATRTPELTPTPVPAPPPDAAPEPTAQPTQPAPAQSLPAVERPPANPPAKVDPGGTSSNNGHDKPAKPDKPSGKSNKGGQGNGKH